LKKEPLQSSGLQNPAQRAYHGRAKGGLQEQAEQGAGCKSRQSKGQVVRASGTMSGAAGGWVQKAAALQQREAACIKGAPHATVCAK